MFEYEDNEGSTDPFGAWIKCDDYQRKLVFWNNRRRYQGKDYDVIKAVVVQHVGMSWLIKSEKQSVYECDKICLQWIETRPWYNTTIFTRVCGSSFEYFYVIDLKYRYMLMCELNDDGKVHYKCYY